MAKTPTQARSIKLRRQRGSQVIHIPEDFELQGDHALIRREGDRLIIESTGSHSGTDEPKITNSEGLVAYFRSLDALDVEWQPIPDLPPEPFEL